MCLCEDGGKEYCLNLVRNINTTVLELFSLKFLQTFVQLHMQLSQHTMGF